MTKTARLRAAIAGEVTDRPPVALWRHFPVDDQDPQALAEAVVAFQRAYDFDLVKVTPASSYSVRDWGVQDAWRGSTEGTREYLHRVVVDPKDWRGLPALDPGQGELRAHLGCLQAILEALGDDVPVIPTVFSPLSQAKHLAGEERLLEHVRRDPESLEAGLETITGSTVAFVEAAASIGVSGIFYAVQHASYRFFDRESYARFGERFDRRVLEAAGGLWLNLLHLHGEALFFDLAASYPVQAVNWHDRHTPPSLAEARHRLSAAVCGGLRRDETLVLGDPEGVAAEALEAIRSVDGRGMILGAGCVVPITAPRANLQAARQAVECV
jgi:uroporphyrinogen decarboxylase